MFIPCLFVFSGCGNNPSTNSSISYSVAYNRTGIPNLNAGIVKSYVLYNTGASKVVLSGLTEEQINNYKNNLEVKNAFVLTAEEDGVDGKWARKNSIDGHDGDKIVLVATQNSTGLFDLDIYYESYFAMQEEISTPTSTDLSNLVDTVGTRGLYFSIVEDQTASVQTEEFTNQGIYVESLTLKKEIVMSADGSWGYNYNYTVKIADDPNFKYANLKIVYNHSAPNANSQMTYLYSLEDPKAAAPVNVKYYDLGPKSQYEVVMQSYGDGIPSAENIVSIITQGATDLPNKHIGGGKIVYKNDVCDVEYYTFSASDETKQNLPFIFKNKRILACNINGALTDVALAATYNDSLLETNKSGYTDSDANNFVRYFFEKGFLGEVKHVA